MMVKPKKRIYSESMEPLTIFHYLALMVSFTAAIISVSFIIESYLNYPTITTVQIERPRKSELPSISLCFFYRLNKLRQFTFKNGRSIYPMSLAQINERLPKLNEWIKSCKVLNATTYEIHPCLQYYNHTVEYLSVHQKCYSFFESLPQQIWFDREAVFGRWLVDITFNNTVINSNHIGIFITHTYAELEDSLTNPSFLQFKTTESNQAVTTFARTAIRNLPAPYYTECFKYETLPCKNRKTCIRHCINELAHNSTGTWYGRTYVKLAEEYMNGYFTVYPHTDDLKIHNQCRERYKKTPCNDYLYSPVITSKLTSSIVKPGTFRLAVVYPTIPKTEVILQPKTKLIDCLCFIGGNMHLCTGVSFMAILILMSKRLESTVRYFKSTALPMNTIFHRFYVKVFAIDPEYFRDYQPNPVSLVNNQSKPLETTRLNQFTSHRLVSPANVKPCTYYSR